MKPIAGVFKLFCSGFDHLVAGQGREDIGESGQGCNIAATAQHHDSGGESDCATGGAAYEADFVVFLCEIEGLTGLAEEFLLECEVHDGLPIELGWVGLGDCSTSPNDKTHQISGWGSSAADHPHVFSRSIEGTGSRSFGEMS